MKKTCATCRWAVDTERYEGGYARCEAPRNVKPDPTGFKPGWRISYCSIQRQEGWLWAGSLNLCGRGGRWWEAKQ